MSQSLPRTRSGAIKLLFEMETGRFEAAVKRFVRAYGQSSERAVKKVGFELLRRTTMRTIRVDTGRMKNGWHASFHAPSGWVPQDGREARPDPGIDLAVKVLFIQNNVKYALYHEFGTERGLSPLLMLTKSVAELAREMEGYLERGIEPLWNREINGIGGAGLTAEGKLAKAEFLKRFEGGSGKPGARRQKTTGSQKRRKRR